MENGLWMKSFFRFLLSKKRTPDSKVELAYDTIEEQLAGALPELRPAAEQYWRVEGAEGQDSGAYIFFESMFGCYVEVLLVLDGSPSRDRLLRRAFGFVEEMFASGDVRVGELAYVGMFEGMDSWWIVRAKPFIGKRAAARMDRFNAGWRSFSASDVPAGESKWRGPDIIDLFNVRAVIASELAAEGLGLDDIPGVTHT